MGGTNSKKQASSARQERIDDIEFKLEAINITIEREQHNYDVEIAKGPKTKARTTLEFINRKIDERDKLRSELEVLRP